MVRENKTTSYCLLLLIFLGIIFYVIGLGKLALQDADEAGYATILKEMVVSGHYGTLTLWGTPLVDKPPLNFYPMALSAKIFGFNEFAMRLPSALFGIAALVLVFIITREATQKNSAALFAALALLTIPLFLAGARNLRMDVQVSAAILSALYFLIKSRDKKIYAVGFGVALAIGILMKGVIALFAIPIAIIWSAAFKDFSWLKNKYTYLGAFLMFTIAAPWHIHEMQVLGKNFLFDYISSQAGRLNANLTTGQITNGYMLWVFWKYAMPYSALLIISLPVLFLPAKDSRVKTLRLYGFAALSSFVLFWIVFLKALTKLIAYPIPSYPFLAIFFGIIYALAIEKLPKQKIVIQSAAAIFLAIGLIFSINEAFINTKLYVSKITEDSKKIGLLIKGEPQNPPTFIYEYPDDRALQFYANRKLSHIKEESATELKPPFNIILPTPLIKDNLWIENFVTYRGPFLSFAKIKTDK